MESPGGDPRSGTGACRDPREIRVLEGGNVAKGLVRRDLGKGGDDCGREVGGSVKRWVT